jgi:hypothetical protein
VNIGTPIREFVIEPVEAPVPDAPLTPTREEEPDERPARPN